MSDPAPRRNAGLALEARDVVLVRTLEGCVPRIVLQVDAAAIPAQAHAALTGAPASGKTLLLRALAAFERPARGTILWGALNVAAMDGAAAGRWRRDTVGLVATTPPMWRRLNARQALLMPTRFPPMRASRAVRERAIALLERVGIPPHAPLASLDAADLRCLQITRALLGTPAIVLADEPTADLDEGGAARVERALRRLCADAGATLILATRDAALAARFDLSFAVTNLALRPIAAPAPR